MTQITLFARYKRMINLMWEDGQRRYTSQELNIHVGQYEASSSWKRLYNNPYYTTRTYQTMLKRLGCIKMIKRGLWEINAPIPSWFSSLHLSALLNTDSRQSLERSSHVWNNLVPQHKINPWAKPTNIFRVIENIVISRGSNILPFVQEVTGNLHVLTDQYGHLIKPVRWSDFKINNVPVTEELANSACDMIHAGTKSLTDLCGLAEKLIQESLVTSSMQEAKLEKSKEISEADLNTILESVQSAVRKVLESFKS